MDKATRAKRIKRRKWAKRKIMRILKASEKHGITIKKVCNKYYISRTQYKRWKKRFVKRTIH